MALLPCVMFVRVTLESHAGINSTYNPDSCCAPPNFTNKRPGITADILQQKQTIEFLRQDETGQRDEEFCGSERKCIILNKTETV